MGKKLFVGNLPFTVRDANLIEIFSEIGAVETAKIIVDRDSGRSKGYGFVEMSKDEDALASIERFHGAELEGRAITVIEAKQQFQPRFSMGRGRF